MNNGSGENLTQQWKAAAELPSGCWYPSLQQCWPEIAKEAQPAVDAGEEKSIFTGFFAGRPWRRTNGRIRNKKRGRDVGSFYCEGMSTLMAFHWLWLRLAGPPSRRGGGWLSGSPKDHSFPHIVRRNPGIISLNRSVRYNHGSAAGFRGKTLICQNGATSFFFLAGNIEFKNSLNFHFKCKMRSLGARSLKKVASN